MIELKYKTPPSWGDEIVDVMDDFLPDHAAAEKKASAMAMTLVAHYPDKARLVSAMIDMALEELGHFRAVVKLMHERGLTLLPDQKDSYVNDLRRHCRQGTEQYFLDRLLIAGIIEARGAERFGLIAKALPEGDLKRFYSAITSSERAHEGLFMQLAEHYFDPEEVETRFDDLLDKEAAIAQALPFRPALH